MYKSGEVWSFKTENFKVALEIEIDYGYQYDGDDPDGETQEKLDNGDFVAFNSDVVVYLRGEEIARDSLCGSVYDFDGMDDFWTAHRDPDPMNRNCTIYKAAMMAKTGYSSTIGHYFPDMVSTAIKEAREFMRNMPKMRT